MSSLIIDYGISNIGSIKNMIEYLGYSVKVSSDAQDLKKASKIILPGVGSFDFAIKKMRENSSLTQSLTEEVLSNKKIFLGICLGMQLITKGSEEGEERGLGWINANTKKFPRKTGLKIPHVGWNFVKFEKFSPLTEEIISPQRYYFTHSYYVEVHDEKNSLMKTEHGLVFDSAIFSDNIFGVQFHPEKSHSFGMKIFNNFLKI
jgi:glutamine amidotransferase